MPKGKFPWDHHWKNKTSSLRGQFVLFLLFFSDADDSRESRETISRWPEK